MGALSGEGPLVTLTYDESVRNLADLGRRHGLIPARGTELLVKGTRCVLPELCACCAGTDSLRTVERDMLANFGTAQADNATPIRLVARFPMCLKCRSALEDVRSLAIEADRLTRQEHPLAVGQSAVVVLGACVAPMLALLGLWWAALATAAAAALICVLLYLGIGLAKSHVGAKIAQRVDSEVPHGWKLPVLANYPGTVFRWQVANKANSAPQLQVWIGLIVYERRFAEAFASCNEGVTAKNL